MISFDASPKRSIIGSRRRMVVFSICLGSLLLLAAFLNRRTDTTKILAHETLRPTEADTTTHRRLTAEPKKPRLLYIMTSLAEYNSGKRSTVRGSDRLQETLIPVLSHSIRTLVDAHYDVDVYLVCHFVLRPERQALIQAALPPGVGLEVWNDATPLGYDTSKDVFTKLENRTLHLARQHRFVIKDKLLEYDHFCNFEDDMIVTGAQVNHFRAVTEELYRLRDQAPPDLTGMVSKNELINAFHGPLTKGQLQRMIPGFIRVEALLEEEKYGAQSDTGPVPVDLTGDDGRALSVNPQPCCHVPNTTANHHIPLAPAADQLMLWETNIMPLGIRQMPKGSWLDWVVLQRGPVQTNLEANETIGDYWTNRNKDYYPDLRNRPKAGEFRYINNQGGWMATQRQLLEWHSDICPGGFLPPYEAPHYRHDGLDMRNVEWYSGGMQLSTIRHACNMQRIITLDPDGFSHSLLYHSANNKQRQLADQGKKEWFVKANTLLGQLNALRKRAMADLAKGIGSTVKA